MNEDVNNITLNNFIPKCRQLINKEASLHERIKKRRLELPDPEKDSFSIHGYVVHVHDIKTGDYIGNIQYTRNPFFSEEELEDELRKHFPNHKGSVTVTFDKF